jgi:hypothetical protein
MKPFSRWWDGKGNYFRISEVTELDNKLWIFYTNEKSNQQYSCLLDAFLTRYTNLP